MGLFDWFSNDSAKEDSRSKEPGVTIRQDKYAGRKGDSKHEHTWSKTSEGESGKHKEGWHGSKFKK